MNIYEIVTVEHVLFDLNNGYINVCCGDTLTSIVKLEIEDQVWYTVHLKSGKRKVVSY